MGEGAGGGTLAELIEVTGVETVESTAIFHGRPRPTADARFDAVAAAAAHYGFDLRLVEAERGRAAVVVSASRSDETLRFNPLWNALLLLATFATTVWAGALHRGVDLLQQPDRWGRGHPLRSRAARHPRRARAGELPQVGQGSTIASRRASVTRALDGGDQGDRARARRLVLGSPRGASPCFPDPHITRGSRPTASVEAVRAARPGA